MTQLLKHRQWIPTVGLTLALLCLSNLAFANGASVYITKASWKNYHTKKAFQQTIDFNNVNTKKLTAAIFHETNVRRVRHGLRPVAYHGTLEVAAQLHADLMVRDNFFSHYHPKNKRFRTPVDRNRAVGVTNPFPAENIAVAIGFPYRSKQSVYHRGNGRYSLTPRGPIIPPHTYVGLARSVLTQWMNSPGHRRNILNPKAVSLGCGARFSWYNQFPSFKSVQNFQFYKRVKTTRSARAVVQPRPTQQRANTPPNDVQAKQAVLRRPTQRKTQPKRTTNTTTRTTTTTHSKTIITRKKTVIRYIDGVKHVEETTTVEELPEEVTVRNR